METQVEREAKFEVRADAPMPDFSGIGEHATIVAGPDLRLVATYFDTPELRLLRRGITVRYRADATGDEHWTLKVPRDTGHAAYSRTQLSWPGDRASIPPEIIEMTRAVAGGAELTAVAEVTTLRRRQTVQDANGRRLAEIDDDRVSMNTPTVLQFRQIEVEIDEANDELLAAIDRALRKSGATRSGDEAKIERALVDQMQRSAGPRRPVVDQDSTLGAVILDSIGGALERLLTHDIGMRLGEDPEFVHQSRVATRRLRSDLKTFRQALDARWVKRIRGELRWLGDALGAVRDSDVLDQRIRSHAAQASEGDDKAFDELIDVAEAARRARFAALVEVLNSSRYFELLHDLEAATDVPPFANSDSVRPKRAKLPAGSSTSAPPLLVPDGADRSDLVSAHPSGSDPPGFISVTPEALDPPDGRALDPERPARTALRRLVRRPWRKLRSTVDQLGGQPTDQELHQLRIRAKQLRYAAEAAAPILGKPAARLAQASEKLQTLLGDHHDAVTAEIWFRQTAASGTTGQVFAAGQCVTLERQQQAVGRAEWPSLAGSLERPSFLGWKH